MSGNTQGVGSVPTMWPAGGDGGAESVLYIPRARAEVKERRVGTAASPGTEIESDWANDLPQDHLAAQSKVFASRDRPCTWHPKQQRMACFLGIANAASRTRTTRTRLRRQSTAARGRLKRRPILGPTTVVERRICAPARMVSSPGPLCGERERWKPKSGVRLGVSSPRWGDSGAARSPSAVLPGQPRRCNRGSSLRGTRPSYEGRGIVTLLRPDDRPRALVATADDGRASEQR